MNIPIKKPEAKKRNILFAVLTAFAILLVPAVTLSAGDMVRSDLGTGVSDDGSLNSDAANLVTADTIGGIDIDAGVGVGKTDTDVTFKGDTGISDIEIVADGLPVGNADVSAAVDAVVMSVAEEGDTGIPEVASEIASDVNSSSGQTFETDLTPDVVVGTNTNTSFTLTIEEVGRVKPI